MKLRIPGFAPPFALLLATAIALAGASPAPAQAQTPLWSGIIAPSRAIDWSGAGVPGGIPTRTTVCASIAPEGTASAPVVPTDINAAIANCPAGEVVYLEAGSFYLSSGIDFAGHSNVTLRGAGADQTVLHFVGSVGQSDVTIQGTDPGNWSGQPANTATWTGGFARGTSQITLSNVSNISPGKTVLVLDQPDDPGVNGGITVCALGNTCTNESNSTSDGRVGRDQFQLVLATAVSGNTVTISPGLYMPNWVASKTGSAEEDVGGGNGSTTTFSHTVANTPIVPGSVVIYVQASGVITQFPDNGSGGFGVAGLLGTINYSTGAISLSFAVPPVAGAAISVGYGFNGSAGAWWSSGTEAEGDGVENLTVDDSGNKTSGSNCITLYQAYGDWVSGVRGIDSGRDQVQLALAAHDTVQNSYFYGSQSSSTESYGVEEYSGSDNLIINNIFQHAPVGAILSGGDEGTVVAYNYDDDCFYNGGGASSGNGAWAYMTQCFGTHETGTALSLWEGNVVNGIGFDDLHGPHDLMTVFRNRLYGQDLTENYGNNTVAVEITPLSRFMNVIGNVVGDPGYTTTDMSDYPSGSDGIIGVGMLVGWGVGWSVTDPLSGSTSMFWGNYGAASGATDWAAADVPSGLSGPDAPFTNPVPSTQALPPSFFLASAPAFWTTPWGTPPWPAIGPDVSGGPDKTGHDYPIPAQLCFQNSPADASYGAGVILFNAGACYGKPPAAPTALTATVQ